MTHEEQEQLFVNTIAPHIGLRAEIRPERAMDKYAPGLLLNGETIADLKFIEEPFFDAGKYSFNPSNTVLINQQDYLRYMEQHPKLFILFFVRWEKQSQDTVAVEKRKGLWVTRTDVIDFCIKLKEAPLVDQSYLLDLDHMIEYWNYRRKSA